MGLGGPGDQPSSNIQEGTAPIDHWGASIGTAWRGDPHDQVVIAWQCYQRVPAAYAATKPADGKAIARNIGHLHVLPDQRDARPGRTLRQ